MSKRLRYSSIYLEYGGKSTKYFLSPVFDFLLRVSGTEIDRASTNIKINQLQELIKSAEVILMFPDIKPIEEHQTPHVNNIKILLRTINEIISNYEDMEADNLLVVFE